MVGATTRPLPISIKGSLLADIFDKTIRIGGAQKGSQQRYFTTVCYNYKLWGFILRRIGPIS